MQQIPPCTARTSGRICAFVILYRVSHGRITDKIKKKQNTTGWYTASLRITNVHKHNRLVYSTNHICIKHNRPVYSTIHICICVCTPSASPCSPLQPMHLIYNPYPGPCPTWLMPSAPNPITCPARSPSPCSQPNPCPIHIPNAGFGLDPCPRSASG